MMLDQYREAMVCVFLKITSAFFFFPPSLKLGCFQGPAFYTSWGQYIDVAWKQMCCVYEFLLLPGSLAWKKTATAVRYRFGEIVRKNLSCIDSKDNGIAYVMVIFSAVHEM